jgi:hypothetical protein
VLALTTLVGCGGAPEDPAATRTALADALARHDRAAIAALRQRPAGPGAGDEAELAALGEAIRTAPFEERALVDLAGPEGTRTVVLVRENGALRVASGILGVPSLDTPERAIAALHRALVRELEQGVGGVLAEPERSAWVEERSRYRDGTAEPDSLDVRIDGDRAHTITPLGDEIVLVREGGDWRVLSLRAAGLEGP